MNIYDFSVKTIDGSKINLSEYQGKVLLIVNTASKCGFTNQYAELQQLQEQYQNENFCVLGFPCDQFMNQEPGSDEEIKHFCKLNFGVTFPLFAKIEVNGNNTAPLFQYLKANTKGLLSNDVKWNFTKFIVDKNGNVSKRYAPTVTPQKIKNDIELLLNH